MFGKNKKPIDPETVPKPQDESKEQPTEVIEADVKPPAEQAEISAEQEYLKSVVLKLEKYLTAYSPQDTANMVDSVFRAEQLNLLFAIFSELTQIKSILEKVA